MHVCGLIDWRDSWAHVISTGSSAENPSPNLVLRVKNDPPFKNASRYGLLKVVDSIFL